MQADPNHFEASQSPVLSDLAQAQLVPALFPCGPRLQLQPFVSGIANLSLLNCFYAGLQSLIAA